MPKDPLEKMVAVGQGQRMKMKVKQKAKRRVMVGASAVAPVVHRGVVSVFVRDSRRQAFTSFQATHI